MTVVAHTDLTTTTDALLDDRAVWTAPVLQHFDTVSAEGAGNAFYGDGGYTAS